MTKIVIIDNKKCQLITDDNNLFRQIYNLLSYKLEGFEYSPAYQQGSWNGITYLMSKKGIFNFGLLSKVECYIKEKNIEYELQDKRLPKIINEPLDISENLKNHNPPLIPRDHQLEILKATDDNDIGIVRAATASGKTLAAGLVVAKKNVPTIIFTIGTDILYQFYNLFSEIFNEEIGIIGDGIVNPKRITICSIWTAGNALKVKNIISDDEMDLTEKKCDEKSYGKIFAYLSKAKLIILDECHVSTTNTINAIYKVINPDYIYGFSGTPYRGDNSDILVNSILGEQICNISASFLIKKGILPRPIIKFISVPKMIGLGSQYLSIYKDYIVENEVRNNLIVNETKKLIDKGYSPLVLFKQIKHGRILYEKFLDAGVKCGMLYGNDDIDERERVKKQFVNGEIEVIAASSVFDIGTDIQKISALILTGSGMSSVKTIQRVGRALRPASGKTHSAIIDFYDQCKYLKTHSKIRYETYILEPEFKVIKSKEMK